MKKLKKGVQLNEAFGAVLTLVLVATLIIVAIYLFSSLGSSVMTPNTSGSYVNETLTSLNVSVGDYLAAGSYKDGICTVSLVKNTTTGVVINAANYTVSNCLIKRTAASELGDTNVYVDYSYSFTNATSASSASDTVITNFSGYPALVGLVGTIIFLGIVIGVLVASFVFGGKKEGP